VSAAATAPPMAPLAPVTTAAWPASGRAASWAREGAPPLVLAAVASQVAVELAGVDQVGERPLIDQRRPEIACLFGGGQLVAQRGWGEKPAEAQPGGEHLARKHPPRLTPRRKC